MLDSTDPEIRQNISAMLECLAARLAAGQTDIAAYSKTLSYLRFRIGEELFDRYALSPPLLSQSASTRSFGSAGRGEG